VLTGDILTDLMSVLTGVNSVMDDKSFDSDDSEAGVAGTSVASSGDVSELNPSSLLELSTQAVAKHCSCATLENHSPPLDEGLLRRVSSLCYV